MAQATTVEPSKKSRKLDNQVPTQDRVCCGKCSVDNSPEAKFCAGCGQSLYENCGECGKGVRLTQSFCGECGADLNKALQARQQQHEQWMAEAVEAAKANEYERAISLLSRITEQSDYRFQQAVDDATSATEKIVAIRDRAEANIATATERAVEAAERGNQQEVIQSLAGLPCKLLSEDARKLLAKAEAFSGEWSELEKELRVVIAKKNWLGVGKRTQQLLELQPNHAPYQKLAAQVKGKLVAESQRMHQDGHFDATVRLLDAIPDSVLDEKCKQLRARADDMLWLCEQFDAEPYATPTLGRLALRLSKDTPNDARIQKLAHQLSHQLKHAPRPTRMHLPAWKGSPESWLGGEVGILASPTSLKITKEAEFRSSAGRLNVAIGLALQGLGISRISEDFSLKKKGLLSFGKRRSRSCWGVDIGTSAIKAVLLQATDEEAEVVDHFIVDLETPTCRRGADIDERNVLSSAISAFIEQKHPGEVPIWVNLSSSATVNRFLKLPPVKDKEANQILNREIESKIPIPKDELVAVRWISDAAREDAPGRPAVACTARRNVVSNRTDLIESCGLKITGMQCDSLALLNFAAYEFASLWPSEDPKRLPDATKEAMSKAVVIVDCGAAETNILIVSGETHWSWSIGMGAEDFTRQLASVTKTTHAEAENLKRNPAALGSPAIEYRPVETRLDELRARLETVHADALRQDTKFIPTQTWCMGGGSQTHQWIRRVLLKNGASR